VYHLELKPQYSKKKKKKKKKQEKVGREVGGEMTQTMSAHVKK
jgi:hypothetical protein